MHMATLRQHRLRENKRKLQRQRKHAELKKYTVMDGEETDIILDRLNKELVPLLSLDGIKDEIWIGFNKIMKTISSEDLKSPAKKVRSKAKPKNVVLLIAMDPSTAIVAECLAVTARQNNIKVCFLSTSTSSLGRSIGLKNVLVLALNGDVPSDFTATFADQENIVNQIEETPAAVFFAKRQKYLALHQYLLEKAHS